MIMGTTRMTSVINPDDSNLYYITHIILDDTKLQRVTKTTFLGVIIDEYFTWKSHIDGMSKKLYREILVL